MKLSEAILLGDPLKIADSSTWLESMNDQVCGCALGGALMAIGEGEAFIEWWKQNWPQSIMVLPQLKKHWPWLTKDIVNEISKQYSGVTLHLRTLEQLVDYVRSVEPAEENGQTTKIEQRDSTEVAEPCTQSTT